MSLLQSDSRVVVPDSNGSPRVSIVVPLYNKEPYVRRALESVLKQTRACFEIIVVDDGSADQGPAIVKKIAAGDDRIRLITQANAGPGAARNRAIAESKGSLIGFLDADDEWEPHFLELAIAALEAHPRAAASALGYRVVYPNGNEHELSFRCGVPTGATGIIENYFQALLEGAPPVFTSSVVIRRAVFERLGGFPPLRRGEDTAFWSSMALSYPIAFTNVVSATFHLDADAEYRSTMRLLLVNEDDAEHVLSPLDRALACGLLPQTVAVSVRRYRRLRLAEMIRQNLMCGHPVRARRIFAKFGEGVTENFLFAPRVPLYLAATLLPPFIPKTYWSLHHRLWSALKR